MPGSGISTRETTLRDIPGAMRRRRGARTAEGAFLFLNQTAECNIRILGASAYLDTVSPATTKHSSSIDAVHRLMQFID
jgi:hypothetical protein